MPLHPGDSRKICDFTSVRGKRFIVPALKGGTMRYDEAKIDEAVLAVLYLTAREEHGLTRAWEEIDRGASNRLHQGLIDDPRNKISP
jgi:hypothetical protein